MASMVFMVLYVIAALAMTALVVFAWKFEEEILDGIFDEVIDEDLPPVIIVLSAVIVGIGWPLIVIGAMACFVIISLSEIKKV